MSIQGTITSFLTEAGEFVFTLTNNGYKFITLNLVRHLERLKLPWKLCILCADQKSYMFFSGEGIPCRRLKLPLSDMGHLMSPFGTKNFQLLNRKKLEVLTECMGVPEIKVGVYLDGDIAVYRDFLPDIVSRLSAPGAAAYLFQCDEKGREECSAATCQNFCTGFVAWRGGAAKAEHFKIQTPEEKAMWSAKPEDQLYVNQRLRAAGAQYEILPRTLYPNGMFVSLQGIKDTAYILHYNYLVGDMKSKRMKAMGDWLIPY